MVHISSLPGFRLNTEPDKFCFKLDDMVTLRLEDFIFLRRYGVCLYIHSSSNSLSVCFDCIIDFK